MPTLLLCGELSQNVDCLKVAVAVLRDPWKSTEGKWGEQNSILSALYPPLLPARMLASVFATPRAVACQAPLSMEFPRQEYWSGLPFPPPGGLPDPGTKPVSPALAGGISTTGSPGKPSYALLIPSAK